MGTVRTPIHCAVHVLIKVNMLVTPHVVIHEPVFSQIDFRNLSMIAFQQD